MEKLGTYIVKLLNENQQVYLPGLGTFKKERVPAAFDQNTNAFLAPTQKIILNTEKGSTASIISAINKAEGSNEEESENLLREITGSILLELNEKGKCHIPDFGEIIKQGDAISFIEDKRQEDLPYYKNVDEIKLIEPSKKEPLIEQETPIIEQATEEEEEAVEEEVLPIQEFEPKGRAINWLWPALIIITLLAAGAFWFFNSERFQLKETTIAGVEDRKTDALPDTVLTLNPEETEASHQDTTVTSSLENTEHAEEEAPRKPETTYEIIIVSFGKLSDAEKYVENMNAKGYKIRILENPNPGNLYKVSYRSFTDENEAQIELNHVRETLAKEAWIYKTKK